MRVGETNELNVLPTNGRCSEKTKMTTDSMTDELCEKSHAVPRKTLLVILCVTLGTTFGIYNTSVVNNLKSAVVVIPDNETTPLSMLANNVSRQHEMFANASDEHKPRISEKMWSVVVASFQAGSASSTLISPFLAEKAGRKLGLLVAGVLGLLGGAMCMFFHLCYELSIAGRFLLGASFGIGMPVSSLFVVEISPAHRRGAFNALLQAGCATGDVLGMVLSLPVLLGTARLAPLALGFTALASLIMLIAMTLAPDSPRHLLLKVGDAPRGRRALKFYMGCDDDSDVEHVFDQITTTGSHHRRAHTCDETTGKRQEESSKKKRISIAIVGVALTALSGVSSVMAYSTDAFLSNGLNSSLHAASYATLGLGAANLASSLGAVRFIERWGRRKMLIFGLLGASAGTASFTAVACALSLWGWSQSWCWFMSTVLLPGCLVAYASFYSLLSAAAFTIAAEVCEQRYRSSALAAGHFVAMILSVISIFSYNFIKVHFGAMFVFFPFSCISLVLGLWLYYQVKETAGMSLEEI